jgi:cobyrinic acid a,c-diamide synthase
MTEPRHCPALFVSAPASNQGKTTVTAALARCHTARGRVVRVFKTGPDFLDPMILERASGRPAYQLDLWMGGEDHCRTLLYEAAGEADLILIEGVMGLFDGTPSSADLAQRFGVPVLAVIDAESMAQSFGAIAHGLASYRAGLPFYGVLANRVAGARHADLTRQGMPPGLTYWGAVMRDSGFELPDRHLGLVQAEERRRQRCKTPGSRSFRPPSSSSRRRAPGAGGSRWNRCSPARVLALPAIGRFPFFTAPIWTCSRQWAPSWCFSRP